MTEQYWSWILGIIGVLGFYLAGKKIWWAWYLNIANQVLWVAYALISEQLGFLVTAFFFTWVFTKNAISWTKEHRSNKPNRETHCMGRWDGDNWVHKRCMVPGTPHAPHEVQDLEDWLDGFEGNRSGVIAALYDYDAPAWEPKFEPVIHPLTPKYEDPSYSVTGGILCSGRPRHPNCEQPVLAHKPHIIKLKETS